MVHAGAFRGFVGAVHFDFLSGRHLYSNSSRKPFARTAHFHLPRLRTLWLSAGVFSPGKFLARGSAAVESVERQRHSVSGRMEHPGDVSRVAVLPAPAALLGVGSFLSGALVSGGTRYVFSRTPLDRGPAGGFGRRDRVCL